MSRPTDPPERRWERGWDGHELAQRRRLAALPLWIKLEWLEESQRLAASLARLQRRERDEGGS